MMWKGKEGGKLLWANLYKQFPDYGFFSTKNSSRTFLQTHTLFYSFACQKKNRGRVSKGNKHLLSQALSWVFSIT